MLSNSSHRAEALQNKLQTSDVVVAVEDKENVPQQRVGGNSRDMPEKALKMLGVDEEQIKRSKALRKLGLTENDMYQAEVLFTSTDKKERTRQLFEKSYTAKVLKLTGMTEEQVLRRKAVKILGTSEAEIEGERTRRLVKLGRQPSLKRSSHHFHTNSTLGHFSKMFKLLAPR